MMRLLIPLALGLVGLGAGVGAGVALRGDPLPAPDADLVASVAPCGDAGPGHAEPTRSKGEPTVFIRLDKQFVVPVIHDGRVDAMVAMALTLEVDPEIEDTVYSREPKLRDAFLRILLDHANTGGFDGTFTANTVVQTLTGRLLQEGREAVGAGLTDILILDLAKQEI